jgi:hypothetical protein
MVPATGPLPDSHWRRYRNVRRPGSSLRIDEVVVGPSGVHVVLECPGGTVGDPLVPVAAGAAEGVAGLLPVRYRARVRPELRLAEDAGDVATWHDDVLLASPRALEHTWRYGPRVLSTSEIAEVSRWLDARLEVVPVAAPPAQRRRWLRLRRG